MCLASLKIDKKAQLIRIKLNTLDPKLTDLTMNKPSGYAVRAELVNVAKF